MAKFELHLTHPAGVSECVVTADRLSECIAEWERIYTKRSVGDLYLVLNTEDDRIVWRETAYANPADRRE